MKTDTAPDDMAPFQPLGSYAWPSMPTQESVRRWAGRLQGVFRHGDKPLIADDQLRKTTRDLLDEVVAPPACGPLERELDKTLAAWIGDPQPAGWLKSIVLPPCDQNDVIRSWAERHGHAVLEPPARESLFVAAALDPARLEGNGVLVIPRLEEWFMRNHRALGLVRSLLGSLVRARRPWVTWYGRGVLA